VSVYAEVSKIDSIRLGTDSFALYVAARPTPFKLGGAKVALIACSLKRRDYTTDAEGRITFYNEAAAALWGCRPTLNSDKWCGSWRMYWPDGTPLTHDQCPMAVALMEKRSFKGSGQEAVAERPDGTRVSFIAFPSPLCDATGKVVGAVRQRI
jgi:PAS domain-containing protein